MRALIEGFVYLIAAALYLVVEVIRALASALRASRPASAPVVERAPTQRVRAENREHPATGPPRARKPASGRRRWRPEANSKIVQMPLFDGGGAPAAKPGPAGNAPRREFRGKRGSQPTRAPEPPAQLPVSPGSAEEPQRPRAFQSKERWSGRLVECGVGQFVDTKRPPRNGETPTYSSYYVTIETEDGAIVTKQGVELEKALQLSGAEVGDPVELLLLGKVAVTVTEAGRAVVRHRNKWRVNRKQEE